MTLNRGPLLGESRRGAKEGIYIVRVRGDLTTGFWISAVIWFQEFHPWLYGFVMCYSFAWLTFRFSLDLNNNDSNREERKKKECSVLIWEFRFYWFTTASFLTIATIMMAMMRDNQHTITKNFVFYMHPSRIKFIILIFIAEGKNWLSRIIY